MANLKVSLEPFSSAFLVHWSFRNASECFYFDIFLIIIRFQSTQSISEKQYLDFTFECSCLRDNIKY